MLYAVSPTGFGRFGILGIDPKTFDMSPQQNNEQCWVSLLNVMLETDIQALPPGFLYRSDVIGVGLDVRRSLVLIDTDHQDQPDSSQRFQNHYQFQESQQQQREVLDYLYGIEELRPLHIGWVILLLVTLALLLGPIDYWVLKKLDRSSADNPHAAAQEQARAMVTGPVRPPLQRLRQRSI